MKKNEQAATSERSLSVKPRIYLIDEFQEAVPSTLVSDELSSSLWRLELTYFLDRFGRLPFIERHGYYSGFSPIVTRAVEAFIKTHEFKVLGVHALPSKSEGSLSYGRWLSKAGDAILSINTEPMRHVYSISASDEEAARDMLNDLKRRVDKEFKNKVVQYHERPQILSAKELKKALPWAELKKSVDPRVAERIDTVLLPFFSRVDRFKKAGIDPKLGVLMHGAPGTGKTFLLKTLIRELYGQATIAHVAADQFIGSSSSLLREAFSFLRQYAPLVLILEDIEVLARSREALMDNPMVQALLDLMDGAIEPLDRVVIIATTNVEDQVDSAFKRPGRFDEIWKIEPPAEENALPALKGYFDRANVKVPVQVAKEILQAKLSYAQLRFVANELIRRTVNENKDCVVIDLEALRAICEMAKAGISRPRITPGFKGKSGESAAPEEWLRAIETLEDYL